MTNTTRSSSKQYRSNRDRLRDFYGDCPVQGLSGSGVQAYRDHYHLLNGDMDDELISNVVHSLSIQVGICAIDEMNLAPPWLKPYWMPLLV